MKVEHVAFYPKKIKNPKNFEGSLHIYLCDYDLDLKDVFCKVKQGNIFVDLPYRWGEIDGKKVKFPIISFCDAKKHKDLITQIRKGLLEFLLKEMKG